MTKWVSYRGHRWRVLKRHNGRVQLTTEDYALTLWVAEIDLVEDDLADLKRA